MSMSHRKEREAEALEWFSGHLQSCLECGALCRWLDWDDGLYDIPRHAIDSVLIQAVGLDAVLRQGVGVSDGGRHVCPPTRATLFPAEMIELVAVGSESEGGG